MTTAADAATRAFVLHPDIDGAGGHPPEEALIEAVALARALRLDVADRAVARIRKPNAGLLFGRGKLDELGARIEAAEVGLVIIDGPLSPVQQRNLEKHWKVKILDRTGLILEIFADRARTREGVLQVELAALSYSRTRLVRSWTHLERQRGGLGFVGGPGETQIEADRRAIDERMVKLRRQLEKVTRTRTIHRTARAKVPFPVVALVGYTNAGKSTLFNRLTGADVMVKDMLFATLDPTMRAIDLADGRRAILSDTVGFIADLPTELVAAFRATLEEVLAADLVLHVRDIASPASAAQKDDVLAVLAALGLKTDTVPMIEVLNKIDALEGAARDAITATPPPGSIVVSALTGEGLDALGAAISAALADTTTEVELRLPFSAARARAWLHAAHVVVAEETRDDGLCLRLRWSERQAAEFVAYSGITVPDAAA